MGASCHTGVFGLVNARAGRSIVGCPRRAARRGHRRPPPPTGRSGRLPRPRLAHGVHRGPVAHRHPPDGDARPAPPPAGTAHRRHRSSSSSIEGTGTFRAAGKFAEQHERGRGHPDPRAASSAGTGRAPARPGADHAPGDAGEGRREDHHRLGVGTAGHERSRAPPSVATVATRIPGRRERGRRGPVRASRLQGPGRPASSPGRRPPGSSGVVRQGDAGSASTSPL